MKTNPNQLDEVYEAIREVYECAENKLIIQANVELAQNIDKDYYQSSQLSNAKLRAVRLNLVKLGKALLDGMNKATNQLAKEVDKVSAKELRKQNELGMSYLISSSYNYYMSQVPIIWSLSQRTVANETKATRVQSLYNTILEESRKGLRQGLRIETPSGRSLEYKGYMEMKVRTEVQKEIGNQLIDMNASTQNIFFLCDSFGNCAPDHRDLQGKLFYDNRYESFDLAPEIKQKAKQLIESKKMISIQDATTSVLYEKTIDGKKVKVGYLTTRPNCRHRLTPISLNQALGDINKLLEDRHMKVGTYKDEYYTQTQNLRKCERNIRDYKYQLEQAKVLGDKEGQAHYQELVKTWQHKANVLVKKSKESGNDNIERDYRRETRNRIIQDLGVYYNI